MLRQGLSLNRILPLLSALLIAGCQSASQPPLQPVDRQVDIDRFMGDWYVIANIPTFLEEGAHNALENYRRNPDGSIHTTFTFREGSFDGEKKQYNPTGFVKDHPSNALWDMQFIWPIKSDYRIVYLDPDYSTTVIGRNQRDYVWIMAREPNLPEQKLQQLIAFVGSIGYDTDKIQRVPQRWN